MSARLNLFQPASGKAAVGELDQFAEDQRTAPAANGNPSGHENATAGNLGDGRDVGAIVEVEALGHEVNVSGVWGAGRLAPKTCKSADDVIKRAPTEKEGAIAAGRKDGIEAVPTFLDGLRFPDALGASAGEHAETALGIYVNAGVLAGVERDVGFLEVGDAVGTD